MKNILTGAVLALALLPAVTFASFDTNLKYGNSGIQVQALQDLLVSENCLTVSPTGFFGLITLKGVQCFQDKYSIQPVSGFFGQLSRAQANKLVSVATEGSNEAERKETGDVLLADCTPGDLFSQVTGLPCSQIASSTNEIEKTVKSIQTTLQKQQADIEEVKTNTTAKASAPAVSTQAPVSISIEPQQCIQHYDDVWSYIPVDVIGDYDDVVVKVEDHGGIEWNKITPEIHGMANLEPGDYDYTVTVRSGKLVPFAVDNRPIVETKSGTFTFTSCQ